MNIKYFFENYTRLEKEWEKFLQTYSSHRNSSALGMTAMRICYYVAMNPDCALKEIALSLNISLGSASQMVQAMTANNILTCKRNNDDKRRISLAPSPVLLDFFKNASI